MRLFVFWIAAGLAAGQSGYVGSEACAGCHADIAASYRKTGMGRSMGRARDVRFGLVGRRTESETLGRTFEVFVRDGELFQTESKLGVFTATHRLEYAVGSGEHGVTFVVRRGDHLFQAPLSYYARTGDWDLSPGYEHADYGFNRPVAAACIACHSGRAQPVVGTNGAYRDPPFHELAIGCENCHGPGERHVKARLAGRGDASIVNPARLPARLAENICINCHQTGDARVLQPGKDYGDFRPGTWLSDTLAIYRVGGAGGEADLLEHWSAMTHSRCFVASRGKLTCTTCHDPHVAVGAAKAAGYYRARCVQCHTDSSCRLALRARQPSNDCAGCHMPKRDAAVISHTALTNHRIVVRAGAPSPAAADSGAPDLELVNAPAGASRPVSPVTLLKAYGEVLGPHPELRVRYDALLDELARKMPEDAVVQGALGRRFLYGAGDAGQAIEHLERAVRLGGGTASVQQDFAEALSRLGRLNESVVHLRTALETEPFDPVLHKTLALRLIGLKDYPAALAEMRQYVELFPEDDFMRGLLEKVPGGTEVPRGLKSAPQR